jgi:hypothetical protein
LVEIVFLIKTKKQNKKICKQKTRNISPALHHTLSHKDLYHHPNLHLTYTKKPLVIFDKELYIQGIDEKEKQHTPPKKSQSPR